MAPPSEDKTGIEEEAGTRNSTDGVSDRTSAASPADSPFINVHLSRKAKVDYFKREGELRRSRVEDRRPLPKNGIERHSGSINRAFLVTIRQALATSPGEFGISKAGAAKQESKDLEKCKQHLRRLTFSLTGKQGGS